MTSSSALTFATDRQMALRQFAQAALEEGGLELSRASADASFRSYWRVARRRAGAGPAPTLVVMDAPPDKEDLGPWLDVDERLRRGGLHAPQVLSVDRRQGFVLMEDLGTRTYLPELNSENVDTLYADALDALLRMQTSVEVGGLADYDCPRLVAEMELLPEWFLDGHLAYSVTSDDRHVIEAAFRLLANAAAEQPRAFVHRDFHSRNLLIADRAGTEGVSSMLANPAIVDFQDAVIGPLTYDLVSLLRDCYIEWEPERVDGWVQAYRIRLQAAHLLGPEIGSAQMSRWFDLMGLQRHIKVLGIFCRLWYRDGKPQYLQDLPLVWRYVMTVARRYPDLAEFANLLDRALAGREIRAARESAAG